MRQSTNSTLIAMSHPYSTISDCFVHSCKHLSVGFVAKVVVKGVPRVVSKIESKKKIIQLLFVYVVSETESC